MHCLLNVYDKFIHLTLNKLLLKLKSNVILTIIFWGDGFRENICLCSYKKGNKMDMSKVIHKIIIKQGGSPVLD